MKSSTIGFALLHLASLCYGAPGSAHVKARQEGFEATITFQGAGPNPPEYALTVPCDESTFTINNPLSVSHIIADDTRTCLCTFNGIDGSITTILGDGEVDVGPPQTQVLGSCGAVFPNRKLRQRAATEAEARQVIEGEVRFIGAGPDPPEYDLNVPCDGSTFFTHNPLSVSHIITDLPVDCACAFFGIDGSVTTTLSNEEVDVGPPQTQVSGACKVAK